MQMVHLDKDHISNATLQRLRRYTSHPEFTPEVAEKSSFAAKSLCMWVLAIERYSKVYNSVKPRRLRLERTQQRLDDVCIG